MTISVFVEDDVDDYHACRGLYEHICEWDGNTEGTVDVLFEDIQEDVSIGDDEIFETVKKQ